MTSTVWLICIIAAIGFAFDIYELLMLPLVARDGLRDLGIVGPKEVNTWIGRLFFIPAFAGGIFGLLGGYLTDRFGRRFILTGSIFLYAGSAFLAGYSTNVWMLLFLRCTTFIGVCIEFVAAVAWLAELFPNKEQREKVLGYTQAFSSIGGLLVAIVASYCQNHSSSFWAVNIWEPLRGIFGEIPAISQHAAWRYTLMSGLIPALPLLIIRPFLPESPVWAQKKAAGTLKRPSIAELFSPQFRKTTIVTTIMFACSYGVAFGAIQQFNGIAPGLANVQEKAKVDKEKAVAAATAQGKSEAEAKQAGERAVVVAGQKVNASYTKVQELGGLAGRFLLAFLALRIISRQRLIRTFQIPSLLLTPLIFYLMLKVENKTFFELNLDSIGLGVLPFTTVSLGMFIAGLLTVAQFSFWGNYLPLVYPVHLRGTGESFAANIGGRMIGTSFAWITTSIAAALSDPSNKASEPPAFSMTTAGVAIFVIAVGLICSFFLPEPKHDIDH
jgi:MFS family permease